MIKRYYEGIFLEESKQRFLCTVLKDGVQTECYISSSSKLSKYICLEGSKVLLSQNRGKKLRTQYTLEAAKNNDTFYYLNLNNANHLFEKYLLFQKINSENIFRERFIEDLIKVDFFVEEYGCYEIKSLLSDTNKITFPDIYSTRFTRQLIQYIELLKKGMAVTFVFIAMSPNISYFKWNDKKTTEKECFLAAFNLGIKIQAFSVVFEKNEFRLVENKLLQQSIVSAFLT